MNLNNHYAAPKAPNAQWGSDKDENQPVVTPKGRDDAPRKRKVFFTNSFSIGGRICEHGLEITKNGVAQFVIAYNFGAGSGLVPLYTECVMMTPPGGNLPMELLKKGTPVLASGYRRASSWVDREGAKHYQVDYVVTDLKPVHDL